MERVLESVSKNVALEAAAVVDNAIAGGEKKVRASQKRERRVALKGMHDEHKSMLDFLQQHEAEKVQKIVSEAFGPTVALDEEVVPRIREAVHSSRLKLWTQLSKLERDHVQDVCRRLTAFFKRHFPE